MRVLVLSLTTDFQTHLIQPHVILSGGIENLKPFGSTLVSIFHSWYEERLVMYEYAYSMHICLLAVSSLIHVVL